MSSKIEINIITQADDEAVVSERFGMSDSVPAPPSSDVSDLSGSSGSDMHEFASAGDAPAPPVETAEEGSLTAGETAAGPPEFSDDMVSLSGGSAGDASGRAPSPPRDHPDVAGDITGTGMGSEPSKPAPPLDESESDEDKESKKGKKGSGGKKKK